MELDNIALARWIDQVLKKLLTKKTQIWIQYYKYMTFQSQGKTQPLEIYIVASINS